jgi:hypothetical protein
MLSYSYYLIINTCLHRVRVSVRVSVIGLVG